MSAANSPAPVAPIRVAAGTTAAAAVREAGLPSRGAPDAIVVVRDAEGRLRDLSWVPRTPTLSRPRMRAKTMSPRCGERVVSTIIAVPAGRPCDASASLPRRWVNSVAALAVGRARRARGAGSGSPSGSRSSAPGAVERMFDTVAGGKLMRGRSALADSLSP